MKPAARAEKEPSFSKSLRAGVIFPVGRIARKLRKQIKVGKYGRNLGAGAPVYMAAVLEEMIAQLLYIAGNQARHRKRARIGPRHIKLAISNHEEFTKLLGEVIIPAGGVVPGIHKSLISKDQFEKQSDEVDGNEPPERGETEAEAARRFKWENSKLALKMIDDKKKYDASVVKKNNEYTRATAALAAQAARNSAAVAAASAQAKKNAANQAKEVAAEAEKAKEAEAEAAKAKEAQVAKAKEAQIAKATTSATTSAAAAGLVSPGAADLIAAGLNAGRDSEENMAGPSQGTQAAAVKPKKKRLSENDRMARQFKASASKQQLNLVETHTNNI